MATWGSYDTTNLHALRRELDRLNDAAVKSGVIPSRDAGGDLDVVSDRLAAQPVDLGKAGARRLLEMLCRISGDESPMVPGTEFTEAGVVRLLAHLRRPRKRAQYGNRFLGRLLGFLTRPLPTGMQTSAGIGVERLQRVWRYLREIESYGWNHVQAVAVARRRKRQLLISRKDVPAGIRLDSLFTPETADREVPQ